MDESGVLAVDIYRPEFLSVLLVGDVTEAEYEALQGTVAGLQRI